MMRYLFLLWLVRLLLPGTVVAQEYGYSHYDITEGLAGSTVYAIAQDREGFLWASTETGVSRFDGTHFVNYGSRIEVASRRRQEFLRRLMK